MSAVTRWLVDGMNLIGTRPDGWWRDRDAAMRALVEELERFAAERGEAVAVVFDGRPFELEARGVEVAFASRRGRDAADDDIAVRAKRDGDPASLCVVTSDRELAARVAAAGATVMGSGTFRRTLDSV